MLPTSTIVLLLVPPIIMLLITAVFCAKYWNRSS